LISSNDKPTTNSYTLSLHDALPDLEGVISLSRPLPQAFSERQVALVQTFADQAVIAIENVRLFEEAQKRSAELSEALHQQTATRSEEHTSELQSLAYLVCRLLLEKK